MSEASIIDWIKKRAPGIGDDCSIYRPPIGNDLVFTTDFTIEGRHFTFPEYTLADVGRKAIGRGLSDIAAMGGTPEFVLVSLAVPEEAMIKPFFRGILGMAKTYKVQITGGDLSKSERLHCDITACGRVKHGKAILRSTAKPGDTIYVTGPLGVWKKKPIPRFDIVPMLQKHASACMDITDGLSSDLDKLLRASGVTAEIIAAPPVARGATLEDAWHHGEDYELLVASPKALPKPFHAIAKVVAGKPGSPIPPRGWDHFLTGALTRGQSERLPTSAVR